MSHPAQTTAVARPSVYDHAVNAKAKNNSHALMLGLIGQGQRVLEVGCATGGMTLALGAQGCTVVGIEIDPDAAELARQYAESVHVVDLDGERLSARLPDQSFDVIVFGDVLEHLRDPQRTLGDALQLLRANGRVVISVPNMAHADVRLALLEGQVPYADLGLLDRTHRHWFTRDNLQALLKACGLRVTQWQRTVQALGKTEIPYNRKALPWALQHWLSHQPEATTYQFIVQAQRAAEVPAVAELPEATARWRWWRKLA